MQVYKSRWAELIEANRKASEPYRPSKARLAVAAGALVMLAVVVVGEIYLFVNVWGL